MFENWIYPSIVNGAFLILLVLFTFITLRRYRKKLALTQQETTLSNLKDAKKFLKQKKTIKEISALTGLSLAEIEILEKLNQKGFGERND